MLPIFFRGLGGLFGNFSEKEGQKNIKTRFSDVLVSKSRNIGIH